MSFTEFRIAVAAALLLTSIPVLSQEQTAEPLHPQLTSTFSAGIGAFVVDKNVGIGVNGSTEINLEDIDFDGQWDLGSSQTTGSAVLHWRFGEKWSVSGQYFESNDSARAVLEEDIEWGDYIFREGTNAGAGIELTVARVFFGRKFHEGPNHEFGAGIGAHWLEIGAYIDGEAFINDESSGFRRESVSAAAPLPNIGAWYLHAFNEQWLFQARLDWLDASIKEYSGRLINTSLGFNYQPFDHFGIGLAYQVFDLEVDVDKTDWRGSAELRYSGPFLSLTATW